MLCKIKEAVKRNVPTGSLVFFITAAVSALLHVLFIKITPFADFFNRYVSSVFRAILAKLTEYIPFSLAEALLISLPVIAIVTLVISFGRVKESETQGNRTIAALFSVIALLYSLFVFNFAAGYSASPLEEKLELERNDLSAENLEECTVYLTNQLNSLADKISFKYTSSSIMPYSNREMISKIGESYREQYENYPFISPLDSTVKQVMLSEPMTYTHISGVYSFFTGEANINVNYPDFILPYTAAHEMAHQRGIAREDEANFVAYLICSSAKDDYIRYSAYLNMYEYVISALAKADAESYKANVSELDLRIRYELQAYSEFFDKYRDSVASEVSERVNNTYLTVQGTEGTKSYGMVVDLFYAYLTNAVGE